MGEFIPVQTTATESVADDRFYNGSYDSRSVHLRMSDNIPRITMCVMEVMVDPPVVWDEESALRAAKELTDVTVSDVTSPWKQDTSIATLHAPSLLGPADTAALFIDWLNSDHDQQQS